MPEIQVNIGGRSFDVACAQGEEAHLQKAAKMIDTETEILAKHMGRLPEARMLLMAGLMLAGPVDPNAEPSMFEQTTKVLSVSTAFPGPIKFLNQPPSSPACGWLV